MEAQTATLVAVIMGVLGALGMAFISLMVRRIDKRLDRLDEMMVEQARHAEQIGGHAEAIADLKEDVRALQRGTPALRRG